MKKIITTFYLLTTVVSLSIGQVINDDCANAIDYGILDGRMTCFGIDGAQYDTCFTVTNLNAIPNFPFYYTNNFCFGGPQDTVNGVDNDVWYRIQPSAFFRMICFNTLGIDTAKITFWSDGGSGCGNFWGSTVEYLPFSNGWYLNMFSSLVSSPYLYMQISGNSPLDTTEFTMCLRGYSSGGGPGYCELVASSYDSLCFATTLTPTNPTTINSNDGNISLSVSFGSPPYSFLWSTGDTTSQVSGLTVGNYSVTITDTTGCSNSYSINLTAPTSISETTIEQHTIYPNPATNILTIETPTATGIYQLHDVTGKLLLSGNVTAAKFNLDISALSKGVYFLTLQTNVGLMTKKIEVVK